MASELVLLSKMERRERSERRGSRIMKGGELCQLLKGSFLK